MAAAALCPYIQKIDQLYIKLQTKPSEHFFRNQRNEMLDTLRKGGIYDANVLSVMRDTPRHLFVSEALWPKAYGDHPLPIGESQTISQPLTVALMTQALGLVGDERVLEIGTGSGYQAAILSQLAYKVYTIERVRPLYLRTRKLFDELRYYNIVTRYGDGTKGWQSEAPFDAIIVTAGAPVLPEVLALQLALGGRMIVPVGGAEAQQMLRIIRTPEGFTQENLGPCRFVKLIGENGWAA